MILALLEICGTQDECMKTMKIHHFWPLDQKWGFKKANYRFQEQQMRFCFLFNFSKILVA